jgi:hypothetical protein
LSSPSSHLPVITFLSPSCCTCFGCFT